MSPAVPLLALPLFAAAAPPPVELTVQTGHRMGVTAAAYSPDGRFAATAAWDNTVGIWDLRLRKLARSLRGFTWAVTSLAWLPDGRSILTGGQDGAVRVIDAATGTDVRVLQQSGQIVWSVAISRDGRRAAAGGNDGVLRLWDVATGASRLSIEGRTPIKAVAFTPDGSRVVVGDQDGDVKVRDTATGKVVLAIEANRNPNAQIAIDAAARIGTPPPPGLHAISSLAVAPGGRQLLTAGLAGLEAKLWDLKTGAFVRGFRPLQKFPGMKAQPSTSPVQAVAFSADGRRVLAGIHDAAAVFDREKGDVVAALFGFGMPVVSAAFSPDGKTILAGTQDARGENVQLWDIAGERRIAVLGGPAAMFDFVGFSPDGKIAYAGDNLGRAVRRWDLGTLRPLPAIPIDGQGYLRGALARDGRSLVIPGPGGVRVVPTEPGAKIRDLGEGPMPAWSAAVSRDGTRAITSEINGSVTLWDLAAGKKVRTMAAPPRAGQGPTAARMSGSVAFSPDGKEAVSTDMVAGTFLQWSLDKGELLREVKAHETNTMSAVYSPDGRTILTAGTGGAAPRAMLEGKVIREVEDVVAMLWDAKTGEKVRAFRGETVASMQAVFSPDGRRVLAVNNRTLLLFDTETGALLRTLAGHTAAIQQVACAPGGRHALSGSVDGTLRLWDLESGAHVALVSAGSEWIAYAPDGVFDASRSGAELVAMAQGLNVFSIDQFAVHNNRPDVLLSRLGLGEPELVEHFRRRYRRRLRKAGLTEEEVAGTLHVPEAAIAKAGQDGKFVDLAYTCSDSARPLARTNVFVNGVPLFGPLGKPAAGRALKRSERVELTPGENRIEVSCMNDAGAESFRAQHVAVYEGAAAARLWFLGFGVSKYRDPRLDLRYAHKDAQDLAAAFARAGQPFAEVRARAVVDAEATVSGIRAAPAWLDEARPDDTLVLFVAGHGMHEDTAEAEYYYLTHEAAVGDLAHTAAPFELFEELLANAKPRRKLFLLDTCESGEVDAEERRRGARPGLTRGIAARAIRGVEAVDDAPAPRPRAFLRDEDRFIYNDLLRRSGAVVLSSSRGGELSYEAPEWENGLFTEELLAALGSSQADTDRDGALSTEELRAFVAREVARLSGGAQNPAVDRDNIHARVALPLLAPR